MHGANSSAGDQALPHQLLDENGLALLRDYLAAFRDLHIARQTVSCAAPMNANSLRLQFQKDIVTIAHEMEGADRKLRGDGDGERTLPKGDMACTILSSLIRHKPCVEPVFDGRLALKHLPVAEVQQMVNTFWRTTTYNR